MNDAPRPPPSRRVARDAREARRAQALRENLRRRKEQARARQAAVLERPGAAPASDEPPA